MIDQSNARGQFLRAVRRTMAERRVEEPEAISIVAREQPDLWARADKEHVYSASRRGYVEPAREPARQPGAVEGRILDLAHDRQAAEGIPEWEAIRRVMTERPDLARRYDAETRRRTAGQE